jgi:NTE family protein
MSVVATSLIEWLEEAPFTLCMSSSFCGWFAHLGVLEALLEAGCRPAKVAGASAGAMVAAVYASGMPLEEAKALLLSLKREDLLQFSFVESGPAMSVFQVVENNKLVSALPVQRLEDCRVPIAVSTFSLDDWGTRVFRRGPIGDIVTASCSVPLLVPRAVIQGESSRFWDGGVADIGGLEACKPGKVDGNTGLEPWSLMSSSPNEDLFPPAPLLAPVAAASERVSERSSRGRSSNTGNSSSRGTSSRSLNQERVLYHHCTVAPIWMAGCSAFEDITTLQLTGLPIVTPFTLETAGRRMYLSARDAMRRALFTARKDSTVIVQAVDIADTIPDTIGDTAEPRTFRARL